MAAFARRVVVMTGCIALVAMIGKTTQADPTSVDDARQKLLEEFRRDELSRAQRLQDLLPHPTQLPPLTVPTTQELQKATERLTDEQLDDLLSNMRALDSIASNPIPAQAPSTQPSSRHGWVVRQFNGMDVFLVPL